MPPTREAAERWNRSLRGFRFRFAHGGHANDLDILYGRAPFTRGEAGLLDLCRRLELVLRPIQPDALRIEPGRSLGIDEMRRLPRPITGHPAYAQPGFTTLFGVPVNLDVQPGAIAIMVTGARGFSWDVFEEDFLNAMKLEAEFERRGIALEPP